MGFRVGAYCKVWKIEDKGNYSVCQISMSRKNKETGVYNTEFQSNYVRFVGDAHTKIQGAIVPQKGGLTIKLVSCDVTNRYDKEKQKEYTNFVIFNFDFPDNNGYGGGVQTDSNGFMNIPDNIDDELPFN
ncbi:MAG: hypothetical protein LUC91_00145 [Prevotella sp.]|nr:hypothetical protein [Prevotella sp.]